MRTFVAFLAVWAVLPIQRQAVAQIKAFPQAEGFGAVSTGGRGGDVYHVTNLNDSGTGSLRHGIENAPSAGRTIVFDVGGWITLNSKLGIDNHNDKITIAGQTAPGGIGVRGDQFSIGGNDIIVRHMRFRPGKGAGRVDSAGANADSNRVIYDHISAGFSWDENFSVGADNFTLQYSTVSYGLEDHSAGSLIQGPNGVAAGKLSFHHNLYAHNDTRNPKARAELIDWRDNVVYNFHNGFIAGDSNSTVTPHWRANIDGNTYILRQSSNRPMITGGRTQNYDLYYGLNAMDSDRDSANDPINYTQAQAMSDQSIVSSAYNWFSTAFDAPEVWQSGSPAAAYQRVLDEFGATPWDRDAVDQLVHDHVVTRTGARVSHENQLGIENDGYPTLGGVAAPTDSDGDGIPNDWETKHGTNPFSANNNGDFDQDGYTDLEEYLNDIGAFQAIGAIGFNGVGRYADWARWDRSWQPSRLDDVQISTGAAFVDAVGQQAGTLQVGSSGGGNGRLYLTDGWLEVTDDLQVLGSGRVEQWGGEVRVLDGSVQVDSGEYRLIDGRLETPTLTKSASATFSFTGGHLAANTVGFDLVNSGGTIEVGGEGIGQTLVQGDLTLLDGSLAIDLQSGGLADLLVVQGHAALGGTLDIQSLSGRISGSFVIMTADSFSANLEVTNPLYSLSQVGNSLVLQIGGFAPVPEPAALGLLVVAALGLTSRRRVVTLLVLLTLTISVAPSASAIEVAGQLLADLRAHELSSNSSNWTNNAGSSLGDFFTVGGGSLNVSTNVAGVAQALYVNNNINQAVKSAATTPSSLEGNSTRSVEAWIYANGTGGSSTPVGWGNSGDNQMSSFRYTTNGINGMFSGWNNDRSWGGALLPIGQWVHVAWTYNGSQINGYLNGALANASTLSAALSTVDASVVVGGGRNGSTDPFDGYLADVRIHTGVLSASDVLTNFNAGIATEPVLGDYNRDGSINAMDYAFWREAYAANSTLDSQVEEVSPGATDIADFLYWRERYGAITSGQPPFAPAPEPTATALLSTLGLACAARRVRS